MNARYFTGLAVVVLVGSYLDSVSRKRSRQHAVQPKADHPPGLCRDPFQIPAETRSSMGMDASRSRREPRRLQPATPPRRPRRPLPHTRHAAARRFAETG